MSDMIERLRRTRPADSYSGPIMIKAAAELERQAAEIRRLREALEKIVAAGQGITNVPLEIYIIASDAVAEQSTR